MLLLRANLWEDCAHSASDDIDEFEEKRFVKTERATVANSATENAAQNVTAIRVARLDAVSDGKTQRSDVVGDDAKRDVIDLCFAVAGCRPVLPVREAIPVTSVEYFFPLSFSISSKIGRNTSVS